MSLLFAAAPLCAAQKPVALRVSADNDGFNFWTPSWTRTDHEYSSGVWGTIEYAGTSPFLPLGVLRVPRCRAAGRAAGCATHSVTLGQSMYTGEAPPSVGVAPPKHPSLRQHAAWLYVEAAERDSTHDVVNEFRLAVGVVGPPALGEPIQKFFHVIGPAYPIPVDWRTQMPFEPGFVATAARTTRVGAFGDAGGVHGLLRTRMAATLGTILAGATAGASGEVGIPVGPAARNPAWPRVVLGAEVVGHGVIRDEFLDGTFFSSSHRLAKKGLFDEERASIELRWPFGTVAYRATRSGKQYELQPAPMVWGTLYAEWRPGRW